MEMFRSYILDAWYTFALGVELPYCMSSTSGPKTSLSQPDKSFLSISNLSASQSS